MGKRVNVAKDVKALGFRSKFEYIINKQLIEAGMKFDFEGKNNTIYYIKPVEVKRYLSDFLLENGIIVECKGFFDAQDRKKHVLIHEQYPELDIRILFMNSGNKLSKRSRTTYGSWCDKVGIPYADKKIPQSWLDEKKSKKELKLIKDTMTKMNKDFALCTYAERELDNG